MACHVLAVPYPGRGHVNPMMNLCKILASLRAPNEQEILITFVVTEEWQGLIGSDQTRLNSITISTIPNVLPSELVRGSDFPGFYEAVMTKMEAPFEVLLQDLQTHVTIIIADAELQWAVPLANRWNIPVATLWTNSASVFSMFLHFHLLRQNEHLGINFSEHGEERVENIPGVSSTRISDLPTIFHGNDNKVLQLALQCISRVKQAQYLLINSIYCLEPQAIDILKSIYSLPVYSIGPAIPFFDMNNNHDTDGQNPNYIEWLNSQPRGSVLYISLGSFLSVSRQQVDELVAGVRESGVRFLWVARGDNWKQDFGARGLVVSWCEQLKVLCHPSVGGFLSHCGWNSVLEATFAGVPILTFPIFFDQTPNSKQIVEDWKVGWRGRERTGVDNVVTREEISVLIGRFMNSESTECDELRRKAKQVQEVCRRAFAEGGTSVNDLNAFIKDVLHSKDIYCRD
ncbi:UDP-glycosyltransferase 87A1-like [Neltuma alba]|uniref:UDP-glycosyltransferase 87A1-like n=1 Tax=Neltuma alba TaxID=207710 RepID=UPI0010A362D2|nr:UDP-glycosyltransferase 87A1-like [Prosopis alba]